MDACGVTPVYVANLGPAFDRLPPALRAFHAGPGLWSGRADIERGQGAMTALILRLGGFPPEGRGVPVRIEVHHDAPGERWVRDFAGHRTVSHLRLDRESAPVERFGPVTCRLQLDPEEDGLSVGVTAAWVFGILPVPGPLMPESRSREYADSEGMYRFDIAAHGPGGGLLIRYRGWLRRDGVDAAATGQRNGQAADRSDDAIAAP